VVRQDSPFRTFADLRGCTWAYNEPRSHSGCYITRYHLAALGEPHGFFSKAIASGAHQTSLQWILEGKIEASAIDSTVLELDLQRYPELAAQIRIIETLGASPIPPWVVSTQVPQDLRDHLRHAFLHMHQTPPGQAVLRQGTIDRFVAVGDRDYDVTRRMAEQAETATL